MELLVFVSVTIICSIQSEALVLMSVRLLVGNFNALEEDVFVFSLANIKKIVQLFFTFLHDNSYSCPFVIIKNFSFRGKLEFEKKGNGNSKIIDSEFFMGQDKKNIFVKIDVADVDLKDGVFFKQKKNLDWPKKHKVLFLLVSTYIHSQFNIVSFHFKKKKKRGPKKGHAKLIEKVHGRIWQQQKRIRYE
ncbi:hypothetical protein RFI_32604 [Reticulomyxa filosa]|uniref:Uncharacterized protein n=1 Tax=Reticulomyxa filosa TaxID=46433 RepID=X6LTU5_RETFI|nr:hypothetical protein RFI_32604 [Reticulomyxa filosa]|eukprot:ETO04791.1 hypothetical protein RFI_32604 [Reticulomyxa filosa]